MYLDKLTLARHDIIRTRLHSDEWPSPPLPPPHAAAPSRRDLLSSPLYRLCPNTGSDVTLALVGWDDRQAKRRESATQDEIKAGKQTKLNLSSLFSRPSPPAPSPVISAPPPSPSVCLNEVTVAEAALNDKLSDIHADLSPALKLFADKHYRRLVHLNLKNQRKLQKVHSTPLVKKRNRYSAKQREIVTEYFNALPGKYAMRLLWHLWI
jgi:hypothetical protein